VVLFAENHIRGTGESCEVRKSGSARDDKKERVVERERAVAKG
jgi:hypothetical protein